MDAEAEDLEALVREIEIDIHKGSLQLPLLPTVVGEVLSGTMDDNNNATGLANLIQEDQALAAHILRVVNSPAYRGASEIVALQQAITRLGMERLREIALSVSLKGSLFQEGAYDEYLQDVWRASLSAGLWAKELARSRRKNVETAYLCGLLHNVGTPVLLHHFSQFTTVPELPTAEFLLQRLSPIAGLTLAENWKLPGLVATTIANSHCFSEAGDAIDTVALVVAGIAFTERIALGVDDAIVDELVKLEAVQYLNLYPEDVTQLLTLNDRIQEDLDAMSV